MKEKIGVRGRSCFRQTRQKKTRERREVKYNCFNCKRIPVNTLNEALKQATVTLQNTTKKDIVNFQETKKKKESHSFDQKGIYMKESAGRERIYTMLKCPVALQKQRVLGGPPHSKTSLKMCFTKSR